MAEPTSSFQTESACPVCGAPVRWYDLLISSLIGPLRCPSCREKLCVARPVDLIAGMTLAGVAAALFVMACGAVGLFSAANLTWAFVRLGVIAVAAGVSGAIAFTLYVVQGSKLQAKVPGDPGSRSRLVALVLGAVLLAVMSGGATFLAMWVLPTTLLPRLSPLSRGLGEPEFPTGASLPVLGLAPEDWALETLDGKEVAFSSFRDKPVFLNVWATWCGPCVAEMPGIESLYETAKDEGVVFLLVATNDTPEAVRKFVEKNKGRAPAYLARGSLPEVFQTEGIPATFILNRRGEIVFRRVGSANWNSAECRQFLRRL